ncbi:glycosyltransferase family 2 protein [Methylobacterium platani]|uniref:glycosyltransferase family 2 protein n=1 Tax=Methylobacterium platani TaxID=427683 RepID=UPI0009E54C3E|nr:glycosyltransferase family 2 protein [Methylobacterium platani]
MRIVAVSRILDEADIIEAFLRHTATFVDHHVVLDNGSRDGTLEIMKNLHNEGLNLSIYSTNSICFSERNLNNWLFNEALDNHGADWVACLDGDEFYDDSRLAGGLSSYLRDLDSSQSHVVAVQAPWVHYNYTRTDKTSENLVPRRMVHRNKDYHDFKVLVSKRLRDVGGLISEGQHVVILPDGSGGAIKIEPNLWICHFGERGPAQYVTKVVRGWSKVLAAGPDMVQQGFSAHYRGPFETIRDRPQDLLRSEWFLTRKNEGSHLVHDPMRYRGGELRYTPANDPEMSAVKALVGHLSELSSRYGQMIQAVPEARSYSEAIETRITKLT